MAVVNEGALKKMLKVTLSILLKLFLLAAVARELMLPILNMALLTK